MANVILENVSKYYPNSEIPAVDKFSLEVKDKEFVVFVGPSGCGKSTTLRMIAGLEDITEGTIKIGDVIVNDMEPKDRDIAMVFQNYALYPHMTIYQNIAFALRHKKIKDIKKNKDGTPKLDKNGKEIEYLRHYTKKEMDEKIQEAAKILEITEYLKRKPKQLSGGQRQRAAIGRAIVRKPKVFLMDEPLSNLDAKLRNQMRAEIIELRQRINSTFIYVTHDQVEAMTLGDRIVIMKDGVIQQVGTPEEVFAKPKNMFVAGFIGSPKMNIVPGEIDGTKLKVLGASIALPKETCKLLKEKQVGNINCKVGFRPEHIEICEKKDKNAIEMKANITEMMGSQLLVHGEGVNKEQVTLLIPNVRLSDDVKNQLRANSTIHFRIIDDFIHLFNEESEENLIF